MRFGIDSLTSINESQSGYKPSDSNTLYLFCGRKSNRIKGLCMGECSIFYRMLLGFFQCNLFGLERWGGIQYRLSPFHIHREKCLCHILSYSILMYYNQLWFVFTIPVMWNSYIYITITCMHIPAGIIIGVSFFCHNKNFKTE